VSDSPHLLSSNAELGHYPPEQVVDQIDGASASSLATQEALVVQQSCFILATNELADGKLPP
jgi:hypothetical protein